MEIPTFWCFECQKQIKLLGTTIECPYCKSQVIQQDSKKAQEFIIYRRSEARRPSLRTQYRLNQNPLNLVEPFQHLTRPVRQFFIFLQSVEGGSPPADPATVSRLPKVQISDICVICKEQGGRGLQLPCGHCFHGDCIGPWFERHNTCPTCRQSI